MLKFGYESYGDIENDLNYYVESMIEKRVFNICMSFDMPKMKSFQIDKLSVSKSVTFKKYL